MSDPSPSAGFKQLPSLHQYAAYMVLGFAAFMIWDQVHWWQTRDEYGFGFLVPLFAGYVIYDRWSVVRAYLFRGAPPEENAASNVDSGRVDQLLDGLALVAFFGSLMLYGLGAILRSVSTPQNPASLAIAMGFAGMLLALIFIFSKERVDGKPMALKHRLALTALFLFPALIWLISAPLVSVLETKIRVFLLTQVTIVVFNVLQFLDFDIQREVNVLVFKRGLEGEGRVQVEEACSGIISLMSCLFAGSFLAAVVLDRFWKKFLMVAAAMCLAVLTNLTRSFFLTVWSYHYGGSAIDQQVSLPLIGDIGTVHDLAGYSVMIFTLIGLLLLLPVFNFKLRDFDDEEELSAANIKAPTTDVR